MVRRAIRSKQSTDKVCALKQELTDDMSQYGYACGYFGSLVMTLIATTVFFFTETTEYEQLTGYGLTAGTSYNEEWLKTINAIDMRFDTNHLLQIQCKYDYNNEDVDGYLYGAESSTQEQQTYNVDDGDYIISIDYWLNSDDSINSLRFNTKEGSTSEIYGSADDTTDPDKTASGETDEYVFAGYVAYVDDDDKVTGINPVMLNQETGFVFQKNVFLFFVVVV